MVANSPRFKIWVLFSLLFMVGCCGCTSAKTSRPIGNYVRPGIAHEENESNSAKEDREGQSLGSSQASDGAAQSERLPPEGESNYIRGTTLRDPFSIVRAQKNLMAALYTTAGKSAIARSGLQGAKRFENCFEEFIVLPQTFSVMAEEKDESLGSSEPSSPTEYPLFLVLRDSKFQDSESFDQVHLLYSADDEKNTYVSLAKLWSSGELRAKLSLRPKVIIDVYHFEQLAKVLSTFWIYTEHYPSGVHSDESPVMQEAVEFFKLEVSEELLKQSFSAFSTIQVGTLQNGGFYFKLLDKEGIFWYLRHVTASPHSATVDLSSTLGGDCQACRMLDESTVTLHEVNSLDELLGTVRVEPEA